MYQNLVDVNWNELSGAEKRIHRPVFSNFCEGIKITLGKRVFAEYFARVFESQNDTTFIVSDWRFKEEYEMFREKFNVTTIKVVGTNNESVIAHDLNKHIDCVIDNKSSLSDTEFNVKEAVKALGL